MPGTLGVSAYLQQVVAGERGRATVSPLGYRRARHDCTQTGQRARRVLIERMVSQVPFRHKKAPDEPGLLSAERFSRDQYFATRGAPPQLKR